MNVSQTALFFAEGTNHTRAEEKKKKISYNKSTEIMQFPVV